jgi:uncharacterized protein YdeI (YjbR/CyaY-like superfamily)
MGKKDPRIDAYIEKAADFAKPVLKHFRQLIHKACPEVEETWKWSFPHFDYHGGPLAHMAAFKQHCAIGFWKASLMRDNETLMQAAKSESAMGHLGKITSLKDLPKDSVLVKYIHEGMRLNEMGVKLVAKKAAKPVTVEPPDYFLKALSKNKKALKAFENFSNSHRKEYVSWITEAKTEETRNKRMATAVEWLSEGKSRNWKYIK